MNVVKKLSGRPAIYNNNAKNCAMYVVKFERNAKDELKAKILLENDNIHLQMTLQPEDSEPKRPRPKFHQDANQEEEKEEKKDELQVKKLQIASVPQWNN